MHFLKTLFWVVLAVAAVLFADANWRQVEVRLWGGLVADVKLPMLVLFAFLLGLVPTMILYRARIWSLRRRLEPLDRSAPAPVPVSVPAPPPSPIAGAVPATGEEERLATDTKVWPPA